MADRKISELTNITGADVDDANDEIAIVDASANETKAITRAELFEGIDGNITLAGTVDGRDISADGSKLDGIETNADVTDTANVTAAGALMDSELTSEASVKALDQGVATTDSPSFAGLTVDTDTLYVDSANNRVGIGTSSPNALLSVGSESGDVVYQDASSKRVQISTTIPEDASYQRAKITIGTIRTAALVKVFWSGRNAFGIATQRGGEAVFNISRTGSGAIVDPVYVLNGGGQSGASISIDQPTVSGNDVLFGFTAGNNGTGTDHNLDIEFELITRSPDSFTVSEITGTTASSGASLEGCHVSYIKGSEAMRIDSSGNVGIGVSAPATKLEVFKGITNSEIARFGSTVSSRGLRISSFAVSGANEVGYDLNAPGNGVTSALSFSTLGTERARINSSGNVGIGTSSPSNRLHVNSGLDNRTALFESTDDFTFIQFVDSTTTDAPQVGCLGDALLLRTSSSEAMRINSSGAVLFGTTNNNPVANNVTGIAFSSSGAQLMTRESASPIAANRKTNDGRVIDIFQDGTREGDIAVSGTTVSYNGGHLSRWSRLPDGTDDTHIYKGTVMTNLDEMCEWRDEQGDLEDNEQLNKTAVSAQEGDPNVAGLFVAWDNDDDWGDYYIAMTGDLVIRIAQGVTVQRGDLLMSAGDGTAKPQGDDIVRSKTVAKVTSTNISHTYPDGSYAVPCVVMAC